MATRTSKPAPFVDARDGPIDDCLSIRQGILFVEGCAAPTLAERFGPPLYVMSEDQLRRNVRSFQAEFRRGWPDGQVVVMPSIKANYGSLCAEFSLRRAPDATHSGPVSCRPPCRPECRPS